MRQNITIEQLNELSEKGRERLEKWVANVVEKDDYKIGFVTRRYTIDDWLLNIGQMIEFLDCDYMDKLNGGWILERYGIHPIPELCDALWEACKKILEK